MAKGLKNAIQRLSVEEDGIAGVFSKLSRGVQMLAYERLNMSPTYTVPFGRPRFKFRFLPLGPGKGSRSLFYSREKYEPLLEHGHALMRTGDYAMDCGANQGIYTCAFGSAAGSEGRVFAVEPIPWQAENTRNNIKLNGFKQCEVVEAAISDTKGRATLNLGNQDVEASLTRASDRGEKIEVDTTTIDDICRDLDRMDMIKLDVEGVELMALKGGAETLAKNKPIVVCEANGDSHEEVAEYMVSQGYKSFLISEGKLKECPPTTFTLCIFFIHPDRLELIRDRVTIEMDA